MESGLIQWAVHGQSTLPRRPSIIAYRFSRFGSGNHKILVTRRHEPHRVKREALGASARHASPHAARRAVHQPKEASSLLVPGTGLHVRPKRLPQPQDLLCRLPGDSDSIPTAGAESESS